MDKIVTVWNLGEEHFTISPIWEESDDDESLLQPVRSIESISKGAAYIKSVSYIGTEQVSSSIAITVSDWQVYLLTLYIDNSEYSIHKSIDIDLQDTLQKIAVILGITESSILPIRFETDFTIPNSRDRISGNFEIVPK